MVFLNMKFWNFKRNVILENLFKKKKETKIGGFLEMKT